GGEHVRVHLPATPRGTRGAEVVLAAERDPGGVGLLGVQGVGDVRLRRLVVRRQRPVHQAGGREQPPAAVGLHGERIGARQRGGTAPGRVPRVVRAFGGREVGDVVPGPGACVLVPPDQLL